MASQLQQFSCGNCKPLACLTEQCHYSKDQMKLFEVVNEHTCRLASQLVVNIEEQLLDLVHWCHAQQVKALTHHHCSGLTQE